MPKSNPPSSALAAISTPADEKWKQQVRLACVQAVTARAAASQAVYNPEAVISVANALTNFVMTGAESD